MGEIETRLLEHPAIKEAVSLVKENKSGEKNLCVYFAAEKEIPATEIRQYLSKQLPGYMIPAYFRQIEAIPLTPNGKPDRNALPAPGVSMDGEYEAPGNEIEKKLAAIWSEVLVIEDNAISINADFFHLGGHSLKAAELVSGIQEEFNLVFPLLEVFKKPTIKMMSAYIQAGGMPGQADENLVLLREGKQQGRHLFLVHDGSGEVEAYLDFCNHLNEGFTYWGLRADRLDDYTGWNPAVETLAYKYNKKIKKVQPGGPYHIAGWSIGGTIAFEMARQLEQMGEEINFLGIIDSTAPDRELVRHGVEFTAVPEMEWAPANLPGRGSIDVIRSLDNARNKYIPGGKIKTQIHYFAARDTRMPDRDQWNRYCRQPFKLYHIEGDHYSIFQPPYVSALAGIFDFCLS